MKKNFSLSSPTKKTERHIEAIKHDIKKYIAREKRKEIPEGFDSWEFDCRIGENEESARAAKLSDINPFIDQSVQKKASQFYLELLSKAVKNRKRLEKEQEE